LGETSCDLPGPFQGGAKEPRTNAGREKETDRMTRIVGVLVAIGVIILVVVLIVDAIESARLRAWAVEQLATLRQTKRVCQEKVSDLKKAKIDGSSPYGKVENKANDCISYLITALRQNQWDRATAEKELKQVEKEANNFCQWADNQLRKGPRKVFKGSLPPVLVNLISILQSQEEKRREALAAELENCKFLKWGAIE
jgi:hypothetical protein